MNINDLKEMCDKDVKIDSTDLDGYSVSIPELANKYHQLAFDERKTLRFLQGLYDVLLRQRWLYYSGKASDDVYEEEPFDLKVLKGDMDMFLNADTKIIEMKDRVGEQVDKINLIDETAKKIIAASFNISNTIKWKKFLSGDLT